jgi:hypothetical protein
MTKKRKGFLDYARNDKEDWIPAFAGMTQGMARDYLIMLAKLRQKIKG